MMAGLNLETRFVYINRYIIFQNFILRIYFIFIYFFTQLLKVDGTSLVGITQERAAEIMMHTGQVVELEVAKQGAIYHGLSALLAQPSPVLSPRGGPQHSQPPPPSSLLRPGSTQPPIPPFDQHLYQNHQPSMMNPAAASPMGRPPSAGMRSASIQNLSHQPLPAPPHPVGNGPG